MVFRGETIPAVYPVSRTGPWLRGGELGTEGSRKLQTGRERCPPLQFPFWTHEAALVVLAPSRPNAPNPRQTKPSSILSPKVRDGENLGAGYPPPPYVITFRVWKLIIFYRERPCFFFFPSKPQPARDDQGDRDGPNRIKSIPFSHSQCHLF